jgi:hypothetical protein
VYNVAQNARSAARGIALSRANENASLEDLAKAMSYYDALFSELLASEAEATLQPARRSVSPVEDYEQFPWMESRGKPMSAHREVHPAEPALRAIATKLEIVLSIVLGALVLVIPSTAILIIATMAEGTQAQGGRFYVAIVALALLGAVNSQIGRILRRRAPSITTSPDEQRHAALTLILFPIVTILLIGLAWRLP